MLQPFTLRLLTYFEIKHDPLYFFECFVLSCKGKCINLYTELFLYFNMCFRNSCCFLFTKQSADTRTLLFFLNDGIGIGSNGFTLRCYDTGINLTLFNDGGKCIESFGKLFFLGIL